MLKQILQHNIPKPYNMAAIKVFTPFGFCKYLTQDDSLRWVVSADNITTQQQQALLKQLTTKDYVTCKDSEHSDTDFC